MKRNKKFKGNIYWGLGECKYISIFIGEGPLISVFSIFDWLCLEAERVEVVHALPKVLEHLDPVDLYGLVSVCFFLVALKYFSIVIHVR